MWPYLMPRGKIYKKDEKKEKQVIVMYQIFLG